MPRRDFTLRERGASLAVSLYSVPDLDNMRARMNHTLAIAKANNETGQLTGGVTPWVALGTGFRRFPHVFDTSTIVPSARKDGDMYSNVEDWRLGFVWSWAWNYEPVRSPQL